MDGMNGRRKLGDGFWTLVAVVLGLAMMALDA